MKILTDLHTHTIASTHAFSTAYENICHAKKIGLEAICIADHAVTLPDSPHIWHFENLKALPEFVEGVRVLRGAETNIADLEGNIDLSERILKKLDIVIASIHEPSCSGTFDDDYTKAYEACLENPYVDIIGHSGTPEYMYDYERVVKKAGKMGKMIEINAGTYLSRQSSLPNCEKIATLCKEHGVSICVNSDAHFHTRIGAYEEPIKMLERIQFPIELIANRSYSSLKEFLSGRKEI